MSNPVSDGNDAVGGGDQNSNDNTVTTGQGEVDSAPTMEQNDNTTDCSVPVELQRLMRFFHSHA